MKLTKKIYFGLGLMLAGILSGCQADMDTPELEIPKATIEANTTIAELKEMAAKASTDENFALLMLDKEKGYVNASNLNKNDENMLDNLRAGINPDPATHYVIKGRIISSDASGNIYQALYIQDGTDAITLSVRKQSTYNEYRIGQEIVFDVTGLFLGKYAGLIQIGGVDVYNGSYQVSFMTGEDFMLHSQKNGLPDQTVTYINFGEQRPSEGLYCTVMKPSQLPTTTDGIINMTSQLVEFRNVTFTDGGVLPFSEYQSSGVNRTLTDGTSSIIVRTSGYATFYNRILPEGTGTVRGLLSYFNGTWQLLIRTYADVMFDSKGNREDPYTCEEAIGLQNDSHTGWVRGFIVGSVKTGVSEVTDNDQIIWGADAERDNNVVIGPTANTKNYKECLIVTLPQGSALRQNVNLLDNPGVYGKELSVSGLFETVSGMAGVSPVSGAADEFELGAGGGDTPVVPGEMGSGTEEDPYTIYYIKQTAATDTQADIWVEGWIVGYINGGSIDTGAQWSATMVSDDTSGDGYNNNNLILGATKDAKSFDNAIPVKLRAGSAVRTALGLRANPGAYLMHVKLKGNINKGFGVRVVDQVTEYKTVD